MPLTFKCSCGATLTVDDAMAGKSALCPACNAVAQIPVKAALVVPPAPAASADAKAPPVAGSSANPGAPPPGADAPAAKTTSDSASNLAPSQISELLKDDLQLQPIQESFQENEAHSAVPMKAGQGKPTHESHMIPMMFDMDLAKPEAPPPRRASPSAPAGDGKEPEPDKFHLPDADGIRLVDDDASPMAMVEEKAADAASSSPGKPAPSPVGTAAGTVEKRAEEEKPIEPSHVQEIRTPDGKVTLKLTCVCGKRIMVPPATGHKTGRCPKCNKLIRIPRVKTPDKGQKEGASPQAPARLPQATPAPVPAKADEPAQPQSVQRQGDSPAAPKAPAGTAPVSAPKDVAVHATKPATTPAEAVASGSAPGPKSTGKAIDRESETPKPEPATGQSPTDTGIANRSAAMSAADRLRARTSERGGAAPAVGVVSAWPRADLTLRGLAAFIDVTVVLLTVSVLVVLASGNVFPAGMRDPVLAVIVAVALSVFNDVVLQVLLGGSLGKRLVVLTLLGGDGKPPSVLRIIVRAFLKWILFPGWIWFFFDVDRRTVHDIVCGTLVLKGRKR